MESIIHYFCPDQTLLAVEKKAQLIVKYLTEKNIPITMETTIQKSKPALECGVCGNQNDQYTIHDENTGDLICLGEDGQGCGGVLVDHMMELEDFEPEGPENNHLFSMESHFRSFWSNDQSHPLRKINVLIEKKLTSLSAECMVTSNLYKDKQRDYVYGLLDNMLETTDIDQDLIQKVKLLYHLYRTCMSRIHKLEIVLAGMFFIVMNQP